MPDTPRHGPDKPATPLRPGQAGALAAGFGKDQPRDYCGKAGRSGPPKGNRNALRHGLKAGQLPKGAKYIELRLNAFRRQLEDSVLGCRGEITLTDAALIQTCLRWERHACLAQRWLVKAGDTLKATDRLMFSREISRASTERDKSLALLKLDRDPTEDAIDALYSPTPEQGNEQDNEPD